MQTLDCEDKSKADEDPTDAAEISRSPLKMES
jgi:hypothetical protein